MWRWDILVVGFLAVDPRNCIETAVVNFVAGRRSYTGLGCPSLCRGDPSAAGDTGDWARGDPLPAHSKGRLVQPSYRHARKQA